MNEGAGTEIKPRLDQEGQTTIELALTLVLVMSFVLFFVHLSISLAVGNYVQYATFMAARAYQAAGESVQDQRGRAEEVLQKAIQNRFAWIITPESTGMTGALPGARIGTHEADFDRYEFDQSWLEGVRYKYRGRLFPLPLFGSQPSNPNDMFLTSESWLGREPSFEECRDWMAGPGKGGRSDNGC